MKKFILALLVSFLLFPKLTTAQNDGLAAAATAITAIGAIAVSIEQMEERAELTATQWVLSNHPELTSFSLETIDFSGRKLKDMSSVSVITFKIQEFTPGDDPELDGPKKVLFAFTSHGWISEYGIDFDKVKWHLIDGQEWLRMMTSYVMVASGETNEQVIKDNLLEGKVVNKGVRLNGKMVIPFFKLSGDLYVVTDYSSDMKLVYNERSLGIFLKETNDLVQIGRGDIIKIHEFFFDND